MNCEHAQRDILLAQSGELSARAAIRLDAHLTDCAACRCYQEETTRTMTLARDAMPMGEPSRIALARIREAAQETAPANVVVFPDRVGRLVAAAAVVALLVGVSLFALKPKSQPVETAAPSEGEVQTFLAMLSTEDQLESIHAEAPTSGEELDVLASQILRMQGFSMENGQTVEPITELLGPLPTETQSRNRIVFPQKTYAG